MIHPFIIGAPFGNYLSVPGVTSTAGTFTAKNRAGFMRWWLYWRILRTLRWHPGLGWTNKLGLPNPGIDHFYRWGCRHSGLAKERIVSIHGLEGDDWWHLLELAKSLEPAAVELNVSCPNVGHLSVPKTLFERSLTSVVSAAGIPTRVPVIVKLPPVNYWETFKLALASGVTTFHCTNTLPVPAGGLSGKPLKRVALDVIARIKDHAPDVKIIGGGGITSPEDVADYRAAGAAHFAVASAFLNPLRALRATSWMRSLGAEAPWVPPRIS